MIQVLFGHASTNLTTGTQYSRFVGAAGAWTATESGVLAPWSAPGVLRNLVVELATAPTPGTRTFTVRKNGAATALTVTISGSAITARLTGVDVSVAAGDRLSLQATVSGTPTATLGVKWSLEFEGTTAKESGYCGPLGFFGSTAARHSGVFSTLTLPQSTAADAAQVVAAAGTLTRTDVVLSSSVTAGNGLTFYIIKNGVRQDGTGGTPNTACAMISATTQASSTYSLPLSPGDTVTLEWVVSGTFPSRNWAIGTAFTATTDGQSQVCGSSLNDALEPDAVNYPNAIGVGQVGTVETAFETGALPGVTTCQLSGLQVRVRLAPGTGKSRQVEVRVAGASPGPTVTISDAATTGSDTTHTATLVDGADRWNLRTTPTGTPSTSILFWGLIQGPLVTLIAVPDVVGDTEAAAIAAIEGVGLTVGAITTALSGSVPAGDVISQSPTAGTMVAFGTAVDFVIAVPAGLVIRINGVIWKFRADSLSIVSTLNGRDTLSGTIDILDDADPPTLNQELTVDEDGVRIFGGPIKELEYRAITSDPDASKDLMVSVGASDFNSLADDRTIASMTSTGGLTLKQALEVLVPQLPAGVTLSATQVDGPVLPSFAFTLQTGTAILDELSKLTEFVWEIDYSKVLTMWQPGSVAAPFNITDGDQKVWGDIVIRPIASDFANRIIVRAGRDGQFENTFAWYSDGVTNNFPMYLHVLQHFGQVLVDTPLEQFGDGYESVGAPGSGAAWEFHDGPRYTQYLSRASGPPPPGNPVGTVPYPIQFRVVQEEPIVVTADDLVSQAANGIVEKLVDQGPSVSSWWELQAIANSLLSRYASRRYTVQYSTREKGLRVGQSQTISIARRNLSGPYFITDVETRMVGATLLKRTVTANETELFQGSWRDTYKLWAANSGGGGGGAVTLGTTVPTSGTVVPHHVQHEPGGMDPMTVDSTAAIGSLRTLGTGANQAAPGDALASYLLRADVDEVIRIGTRAAQPAATAVLAGTLYCVTDDRYEVERSTGTVWETFVRRRHVAIFAYDYSSTTTAPPASTTIRFNAAAPYTAVTKVWLHTQTNDGRDVYLGLIGTDTGARVTIQDKNDHTIYATFTLTGAPVDNTTYIEWPVVYHSNGGASLLNNQAVLVMKQ